MAAEWQEFATPAVGAAPLGRAPELPLPPVPTLHDDGAIVLEVGEAGIGAFPASKVRLRARIGNVDQRWGPLDMRVTVTTHRVVMITSPGTPAHTSWSTTGTVPVVLRAIEPAQTCRGRAPVRVAGHVRWINVTRVDSHDGRVVLTVPASLGRDATISMSVPRQLSHRLLAIARAAFVAARRPLVVDTATSVGAAVR